MYMIPSSLLTVCRVSGPVGHWVNRFLIESRKLGLLSLSRFVPSEHKSHLQRLARHGVIHLAPRILGLCSLLQWMLSGTGEASPEMPYSFVLELLIWKKRNVHPAFPTQEEEWHRMGESSIQRIPALLLHLQFSAFPKRGKLEQFFEQFDDCQKKYFT